jgi:hypothetical protein
MGVQHLIGLSIPFNNDQRWSVTSYIRTIIG